MRDRTFPGPIAMINDLLDDDLCALLEPHNAKLTCG